MPILQLLNSPRISCVMALVAAAAWSPHLFALQPAVYLETVEGSELHEVRALPMTNLALEHTGCRSVALLSTKGVGAKALMLVVWWSQDERTLWRLDVCDARDRSVLQRLENAGDWLAATPDQPGVRLEDFNFDGYPDLEFTVDEGNHDGTYERWLYDPVARRFVFDKPLSDLCRLHVEEDQSLVHYGHVDANLCTWSRYRYVQGELTEVERGMTARRDGRCHVWSEVLRDGKFWLGKIDSYEE